MRLRRIKGADEAVESCPFVVQKPEEKKGIWKTEIFRNNHPIHIEIGMGKGRFILTHAAQEPDINFIGIEKETSVLLRGIQKQNEAQLPNLRFLCLNAENLTEIFDSGEVDRIYLNFSDPWPKDRHAKRRLTSREFLARYEAILSPAGTIECKTDNEKLFDFSLEEIEALGWPLIKVTRNLVKDPMNETNIETEYEIRFKALGNPIYKLITAPKRM